MWKFCKTTTTLEKMKVFLFSFILLIIFQRSFPFIIKITMKFGKFFNSSFRPRVSRGKFSIPTFQIFTFPSLRLVRMEVEIGENRWNNKNSITKFHCYLIAPRCSIRMENSLNFMNKIFMMIAISFSFAICDFGKVEIGKF